MRLLPLHCILASALCGTAAHAAPPDCDLAVRAVSPQQIYDPFTASNALLDVAVDVTNTGGEQCQARVYLQPLNGLLSLASGSDRLLYRVDGPRGGGQAANSFGPFVLRLNAGATERLTVRVVVPAQQIVPRGDYLSDITVSAVTQGNDRIDLLGPPLTLRVRVPGRVEMSVSGSIGNSLAGRNGTGAAIAFGEAVAGKTDRVFVHVWSNGGVSVSLDSANRGRMRLQGGSAAAFIDYAARFDGAPAPLAGRYTVRRAPPPTLAGGSYELAVTLGDVAGKYAGTYKDVITVTVDQN